MAPPTGPLTTAIAVCLAALGGMGLQDHFEVFRAPHAHPSTMNDPSYVHQGSELEPRTPAAATAASRHGQSVASPPEAHWLAAWQPRTHGAVMCVTWERLTSCALCLAAAADVGGLAVYLFWLRRRRQSRQSARVICGFAAELREPCQKLEYCVVGDSVARADRLLLATSVNTQCLTEGVERLAEVVGHAGEELQAAFSEFNFSKVLDKDARAVAELFVAWREVGDANVAFATRMLNLSKRLKEASSLASAKRAAHIAEAERLQQMLAKLRSEGWLSWLRSGGPFASACAKAAKREEQEQQRITIMADLDLIPEQMHATQRCHGSAADIGLSDVRTNAKIVGDKLMDLHPSRNDTIGSGKQVRGLVRELQTADGRRRLRDAEIAKDLADKAVIITPTEMPMMAIPVKQADASVWNVGGLYHHQVLKVGLRQLDEILSVEGLEDFPRARDGSSSLFREGLFRKLITGLITLNSVPASDIAAAQGDLRSLSLSQLLRLRVQHLEYTPSGCGADTVITIGATHLAFLTLLDGLVFERLGLLAVGEFTEGADVHRLGCEAVLFAAVATSIPSPPSAWWCWWPTEDRRVFLRTPRFAMQEAFPEGGVFEVTDRSKPDCQDPTKRLRWFDWRVELVLTESNLSACPCRSSMVPTVGSMAGDIGNGVDISQSASPCRSFMVPTSSGMVSAGAATATLASPDVLLGARRALRRVDGARSAIHAPEFDTVGNDVQQRADEPTRAPQI